jgi:hypothetical protein
MIDIETFLTTVLAIWAICAKIKPIGVEINGCGLLAKTRMIAALP